MEKTITIYVFIITFEIFNGIYSYTMHECVNAFKLTSRANSKSFDRIITALNKHKKCAMWYVRYAARCIRTE